MIYTVLEIVSYLLLGAAVGIVVLTFKNRIKFHYGVISASGTLLLATIIQIYYGNKLSGTNLILTQIDEVFNMLRETLGSLSTDQMRNSIFLPENIETFKKLYTLMFPSVLILNTLLASYTVFMIVKQFLALFKKDVSAYPKFSELKLRRSAVLALGISYILPFFIKDNVISAAVSNLTLVICGVSVVCGLSYIDFSLRSRMKSAWLRFTVYIAVFITAFGIMPLAVFALTLTAVADSFFDFRGLDRRGVEHDGQ